MPGIELLDYTKEGPIRAEERDEIINIVHDVIATYNGKIPGHSNFRYTPAGYLDKSGYSYILVVDGETTEATQRHQDEIRKTIKERVHSLLKVPPEFIAVRYRLMNASFG